MGALTNLYYNTGERKCKKGPLWASNPDRMCHPLLCPSDRVHARWETLLLSKAEFKLGRLCAREWVAPAAPIICYHIVTVHCS